MVGGAIAVLGAAQLAQYGVELLQGDPNGLGVYSRDCDRVSLPPQIGPNGKLKFPPKNLHPNKYEHWAFHVQRGIPWRRRRMNAGNTKALLRAARRLKGWSGLCDKTDKRLKEVVKKKRK